MWFWNNIANDRDKFQDEDDFIQENIPAANSVSSLYHFLCIDRQWGMLLYTLTSLEEFANGYTMRHLSQWHDDVIK